MDDEKNVLCKVYSKKYFNSIPYFPPPNYMEEKH